MSGEVVVYFNVKRGCRVS